MTNILHSPLGKPAAHAHRYDPGLLFAIARAPARADLGLGPALPFDGVDIWNAYELSWLDGRGKPQVALAEFRFPALSPNIVESKSFKLYLNSFSQERLHGVDELRARLAADLSTISGAEVAVELILPRDDARIALAPLEGESIDGVEVDLEDYGPPNAAYLRCGDGAGLAQESLVSDLLKSNCPVTGQPDWASVQVRYTGARIDRAGLLRYLVSFRRHAEFHEHCVERIFVDLMQRCAPRRLSVYARYTRRGGLDINPWRSTEASNPSNGRTLRQ